MAVSGHGVHCGIRDVPPHPTQATNIDLSGLRAAEASGVRILRIFVELYIDAFGVFQKRSYAPDGIYVTFGNMCRAERNKLDNIWCVGMKPPHTDMNECLTVFIADIKKLQYGFYATIRGERVYIIGALGIVKAGTMWHVRCMSRHCTYGITSAVLTSLFVFRYATGSSVSWVQKSICKQAMSHVPRRERSGSWGCVL